MTRYCSQGHSAGDIVGIGALTLVLEERVYPDPSAGQWEDGFLAYPVGTDDDFDAPRYFVSDTGTVWGQTELNGPCDVELGKVERHVWMSGPNATEQGQPRMRYTN